MTALEELMVQHEVANEEEDGMHEGLAHLPEGSQLRAGAAARDKVQEGVQDRARDVVQDELGVVWVWDVVGNRCNHLRKSHLDLDNKEACADSIIAEKVNLFRRSTPR